MSKKASSRKKKSARNWRQTLIVSLMILAIASMLLPAILPSPNASRPRTSGGTANPNEAAERPVEEPSFTKEGELTFIDGQTGQPIKTIDIEKAETEQERMQGLMYRSKLSDQQGMLFIFEKAGPQSFWMRNTYIPLDIIFVDEHNTILNIHENARPRSEASLPSRGNAKYVVEVVGGFCRAYGIEPGDKIEWK
ncbi:MAG: hypothetical protein KatS3mg029_0767 [Saprospiraceae bacterium]|nr:MAG: hypothetical protein KatS3mg029_0767 [Saprospiraceae bacterium]